MPTHVIGLMKSMNDKDTFAKYREVAGAALAKHGGRVLSSTPGPKQIEGTPQDLVALVILEFPDADAAQAWRQDPDLTETHALRTAAADFSFYIAG